MGDPLNTFLWYAACGIGIGFIIGVIILAISYREQKQNQREWKKKDETNK